MKHNGFQVILLFFGLFLLNSCVGFMQPLQTEPVAPGTLSRSNESLRQLPEPEEKIVAAVYRFRDQTGQYKPSDRVASWSTAVTQGATSILTKSLEDSGWFTTIERESISNLLNERQIIQNLRQQHAGEQRIAPLPPLLFAGIIMEGGIIGYDTNIITGGMGARYLGIGGSGQYRKDQVTIYLRAVSTQSGRILKTVHTTKSIISQQLESGVFKYIDTKHLLEAETGYTYNEPPVMAVTEAIDEAVKLLILEGLEEGLWSAKNRDHVVAYREQFEYEQKIGEQLERDYFGFITRPEYRRGWAVSTNTSMGSVIGNYENPDINAGFALQIEKGITPAISLKTNIKRTKISAPRAYSNPVNALELMANTYMLPDHKLSPFIAAGGGAFIFDKAFNGDDDQLFPFVSVEAGLDYRINRRFGVRLSSNYRYLLIDGIDGITLGKYNDQHWSVNAGIVFQTGF